MDYYYGLTKEEGIQMFKDFPFVFTISSNHLRQFMGVFKNFNFSKEEFMHLNKVTPILACDVSNLRGIFFQMKTAYNIDAKTTKAMILKHPEMIIQTRGNMI